MSESWYVYIVRCRDGSLYTGITNDVKRRVAAHNEGKGARYTRSRHPVKLVAKERCGSKSAALKREAEIKSMRRPAKLGLVRLMGSRRRHRIR